ncbi:MAG: hypothetical protein ABIO44_09370, partial [Saprospiraceae bacterium]
MKYILFGFLAILMREVTIGQCLPASNGICDGTPVLCSANELNGYSCQLSGLINWPSCDPVCPSGGKAYNTEWWRFWSFGGNVCVTVSVSNCNLVNKGIQFGLMEDCCTNYFFCESNCFNSGSRTLCAELRPCTICNFFINGCEGDVCNVNISVTSTPPTLGPSVKIDGNASPCFGSKNNSY